MCLFIAKHRFTYILFIVMAYLFFNNQDNIENPYSILTSECGKDSNRFENNDNIGKF